MDLVISGLVLLVIGGLGIFLIREFMSSLQKSFNINGHIPAPNGAGKHISLTRVNGCGMSFTGNYRRANIDQIETYVTYYTLYLFFVPLIPFKAYRACNAENGGYHVLGSEKGSYKERILIVSSAIVWVLAIIGGVYSIGNLNDYLNYGYTR